MAQCQAKSKRSSQQCRAWAMHGKQVCYHHGGASPGRPIIHGRYSKELPLAIAKLQRARRQRAIEELNNQLEHILLAHLPDLALALDRLSEEGESANLRLALAARAAPIREVSRTAIALTQTALAWVERSGAQAFYDRE